MKAILRVGELLLVSLVLSVNAWADVVVVANRTKHRVPIEVTLSNLQPWSVTLAAGESRPIFSDGSVEVVFDSRAGRARYSLDTSSVYFLGSKRDGTIDLQKVGLGAGEEARAGVLPGSAATTPVATIPVKILVDEEELARQYVWEPRLRKRIEAASDILHRHAMIKLQVVAVDRWESDDSLRQFHASLAEFEREVVSTPAELSIGFTSQYNFVRGRVHLGGTHGPLKPHILIREWSKHVSETERLELLLHELGHYLGAAHSPEPDSVMRPVLGDRQSMRKDFVIKFDPVNTLLMSMMGEEIRRRRVRRFSQLTSGTKKRMEQVYQVLGEALPKDTSPRMLTRQLGNRRGDPLYEATKGILAEMTRAARTNSQAPEKLSPAGPARLAGDDLFNAYVRVAAESALEAPKELRAKAFLLAIGIGIGDSEQLSRLPALRGILSRVESPADRSVRQTYLGKPTIQDRHDLARHFCVAAMLVATSGKTTAETLSLAKEVLDAQGGTGFSFPDLTADKAGIKMAEILLEDKRALEAIATRFRSRDFIPSVSDLPEGMSTLQFMEQYGGANDERYLRVVEEIEKSIEALPVYKPSTAGPPRGP